MLISFERRFVFVHVNKAAGTSIQRALEPFAKRRLHPLARQAMRLHVDRLLPVERRMFREHATADQIRRSLPSGVFDSFYTFAFVRNPWDRLVSQYSYLLRTESHRHHAIVKAMDGFGDYVDFQLARGSWLQSTYVVDRDGKILVDFVGRFERLTDDFSTVCETIGVEATMPHVNASKHKDYRDYYDDATRERVGEHFREDVERFEYTFDG